MAVIIWTLSLALCCGAASGAPQVIVELRQNNDSDLTYASNFADPIAGTDAATLQQYKFQRQRKGRNFTYVIANLEPGSACTVELSFVEHEFDSPGRRRFNVYVQSELKLRSLDIFAAVGADNACQGTVGARVDSKGLLAIQFRSDEAGCVDYATISTIRVFRYGADIVEVDASQSRNNMSPPIQHYNTETQDTREAILGRLGARASLDLLPQRLASRFTTLGTWTGDLSELVVGLKCNKEVRALPFTDRFPAWENIRQKQTMTSQAFDCSSGSMPLKLTATFRAPFYPKNERVSSAPFFYIDLKVQNTGSRTASGTLLLARPSKEGFASAGIKEFVDASASGIWWKTSYSYCDETVNQYDAKKASEALAVPAAEAAGVDFRGASASEFGAFTAGSLWGWSSPAGYPAASNEPKSPVFSFYPRGYTGCTWTISDLAPGATATRHFVLAGYISDKILSVKNSSYQDATFRFRYNQYFNGVTPVVDYAADNMTAGDDIIGKSAFFDSTVGSDDFLAVDPACEDDLRNLIACGFQTYLTNTWWAHSGAGRDWFSVWEGTWMRFHGTVDVEYNQAWFYYDFWPDLLPEVMDEWLLYPKSNEAGVFVPHDVGIGDQVAGQVYDHDMPVEENLNYILMLYRYWKSSGNTSYVAARLGWVRKLTQFLINCDTNGNGLPDKYSQTTFDDGTPALEGGKDQSYLGFKCMAAYRAAREMALGVSPADASFAATCQGQVELINQTLDYDAWLSDHYAVCLDGGVERADREAYSIHTGNGLLYLLGGQRDIGVTSVNFARLREDITNATPRTWGPYGSRHTSYDPGRMWISSNLWRDALAGYTGAKLFGRSPLALSSTYWEFEKYLATNLSGGYWDGMIYGSGADGAQASGSAGSAGSYGDGAGGMWPSVQGGRQRLASVPAPVGIIAERPTYFDYRGLTGGHDVVGVTNPSSTFYFAEGSTRPGFDPYLCLQNPGASAADVKITYMLGNGQTRGQTLAVAPHSRSTIRVTDTLGQADDDAHDFSAKVETTNGTAGSPLMSYYPRGTASLGLIDAAVGLVLDNPQDALYYQPPESPMRVPVFNRADWAAADPARRVPTLDFPGGGAGPAVSNRDLLPQTVGSSKIRDLGNVSAAGHALDGSGSTKVSVSYRLPVASTVRASIWEGGRRVRAFATEHLEGGRQSFQWDGLDDDGRALADGRYTARIDATPDDGSEIRPASAAVWVNSDVPGLARDWYLAEGYTGANPAAGDFEEYILVENPGAKAARLTATFMLAEGTTADRSFVAAPHSRLTISVDSIIPHAEVSTHVSADRAIAVERSMYFNGRRAGHDSIGVSSPATTWYLAEGCTRTGFDEYVLVQNPGSEPANVSATFMTVDGTPVQRQYQVRPHSRLSVHVNEMVPGQDVSTVVESDRPVVVERSQYLNDMTGGTCSIGARSLSRTWFLAEGYTDRGFEEYVLLENARPSANAVTLFFMDASGTTAIRSYTVGARSRFTVAVGDVLPGREVSVKVSARYPLAVERAMYWNYRSDGHATIGTPAPDSDWYLPDGYTGGGFETWVLVQNPGDEPRSVTVTFLEPSGRATRRDYRIAPRSRFTVAANAVLPSSEFSTQVHADGPVIVEKSVYFNGRSGGTCSIGVRGSD